MSPVLRPAVTSRHRRLHKCLSAMPFVVEAKNNSEKKGVRLYIKFLPISWCISLISVVVSHFPI